MRISQDNNACVPCLSRTALMSIVTTIWQKSRLHLATCKGFRDNMFTIKLDGTEDHLGSEQCQKYWSDAHMKEMRELIMADVKDDWERGEVEDSVVGEIMAS